jgi:hypothetical protein
VGKKGRKGVEGRALWSGGAGNSMCRWSRTRRNIEHPTSRGIVMFNDSSIEKLEPFCYFTMASAATNEQANNAIS